MAFTTKEEVFRSITRDTDLHENWAKSLEEYEYIDSEPELGIYSRYIDLRELPPVLHSGGIVVDVTDTHIKMKIGYPRTRYWTINRDFVALFQKRSMRFNLIQMAEKIIAEKLG